MFLQLEINLNTERVVKVIELQQLTALIELNCCLTLVYVFLHLFLIR